MLKYESAAADFGCRCFVSDGTTGCPAELAALYVQGNLIIAGVPGRSAKAVPGPLPYGLQIKDMTYGQFKTRRFLLYDVNVRRIHKRCGQNS
jgi:hypothetical protein